MLVDNKLKMSQQCALATTKAKRTQAALAGVASKLRGVIISLFLALERLHLECCVQFELYSVRKTSTYSKESVI